MMSYLHGYEQTKAKFLYLGLTYGFSLHYKGPLVSRFSENHSSSKNRPEVVRTKLEKEIVKGKIAGPYDKPPFKPFVVSPIGLVPKRDTGKFRLIHDLSFPKLESVSVNANIPREFCTVQYEDFDFVVTIVIQQGQNCYLSKLDIEAAFRILPMSPSSYWLLGIFWEGKYYYDKFLPMGASISCSTFEEFSRAIQWILQT